MQNRMGSRAVGAINVKGEPEHGIVSDTDLLCCPFNKPVKQASSAVELWRGEWWGG